MTLILACSRKTVLAVILILLIAAAAVLSALLPPLLQSKPPRIAICSPYSALAEELLPDGAGEIFTRNQHPHLDGLDYYITSGEPLAGWISHPAGDAVAALIVSYFNPRTAITHRELEQLLAESPEKVLISQQLALPGLPWFDRYSSYLPSQSVLEQVAANGQLVGIVPLHHRTAAVRVLPVDGLDPRRRDTVRAGYPLTAPLLLQHPAPNLWQRLRQRLRPQTDPLLDHLDSAANPYRDLWQNQASFVAAGDVMLDRDVKKEGQNRGWEWIFAQVAPFLSKADLAFCNLECPIGQRGRFINMFQAPREAILGMASAGFDIVSLANNHILDYHFEGMFETIELLAKHDIAGVGAGRDIAAARKPVILEVNGIRVGFLAYTEMWFVHAREPISWQATETEPGVAPAKLEYVVEDVSSLREQTDIVVVSFHWGREYDHQPTDEQIRLGRAAIDAGAHLVLGHHPHVLQGIEFYRQGVIAYSLGNFVFDQRLPHTQESMVLAFTFSRRGILDLTIHPAHIYGFRPRLLGEAGAGLAGKIRSLSQELAEMHPR